MDTPKQYDQALDSLRPKAIPIIDLMDSPDGLNPYYADYFTKADVVFGLDVGRPYSKDAWTVFHGRGFLQDAAHGGKAVQMHAMAISYDQRSNELEALCACCIHHRGGCDYRGGK